MHPSIENYLTTLQEERRSALTVRAVRSSLLTFTRWWEDARGRAFDPALVRTGDVEDWRLTRQRDEGAAPATINRGLSLVRGYGAWATRMALIQENPAHGVAAVPTAPLSPKGLPAGAVDALLREAHTRTDTALRLRDEALLALLAYAGLRVQEVCDVQLRDLDVAGSTIIVRHGKAGKARRVPLHSDAQRLLGRYLEDERCPAGGPAVGSAEERRPLFLRREMTQVGQTLSLGITQRLVQRVVKEVGQQAAARLRAAAPGESNLERAATWLAWATALETVTPHTLRHSLARRMLARGAQLAEVQRVLGHSRLSTTGIYLTPNEDDVRTALERSGV